MKSLKISYLNLYHGKLIFWPNAENIFFDLWLWGHSQVCSGFILLLCSGPTAGSIQGVVSILKDQTVQLCSGQVPYLLYYLTRPKTSILIFLLFHIRNWRDDGYFALIKWIEDICYTSTSYRLWNKTGQGEWEPGARAIA